MSGCCAYEADNKRDRRLLWVVLLLNGGMFIIEFVAGWMADSSGLLADSLDMFADAAVYGVSLYAVGRAIVHKANAALLNGGLQFALGSLILLDLAKRLVVGSTPQYEVMLGISSLALVVNASCFALLYQFRNGDINLRASWICSRNDMIANLGVMLSAGMVYWLNAAWPDWFIGGVIALIILHSSTGIIREARQIKRDGTQRQTDGCH